MRSQRLSFPNSDGVMLAGRLDFPEEGDPAAYAVFAHCFTCTKNLKAIGHISQALTDSGVAVLRFDFTGLGESGGEFDDTNFTSNTLDLVSAAKFLKGDFRAPRILIGHSLGGAAVLQSAADIPSSRAVATIGAPCEPSHVEKLLGDAESIKNRGEVEITIAGRTFKIKKQFIEDLEQTRMQSRIENLKRALLVLHSPFDSVVGIENAAQIFHHARHPKSFISLDRADHLLMDERDSHYAGQLIATWSRRYLAD